MSEKNKNILFFGILTLMILISISFSYYKYIVKMDYQVFAHVACDKNTENCFEEECVDSDNCEINSDGNKVKYYKIISKNAYNIYMCRNSSNKEGCTGEYKCTLGESNCSYEFCTSDNSKYISGCSTKMN